MYPTRDSEAAEEFHLLIRLKEYNRRESAKVQCIGRRRSTGTPRQDPKAAGRSHTGKKGRMEITISINDLRNGRSFGTSKAKIRRQAIARIALRHIPLLLFLV